MKKTLLLLATAILIFTGCSKTWSGVKQDTNKAYKNSKEAIHEATA